MVMLGLPRWVESGGLHRTEADGELTSSLGDPRIGPARRSELLERLQ
jgi:hypothetical protein